MRQYRTGPSAPFRLVRGPVVAALLLLLSHAATAQGTPQVRAGGWAAVVYREETEDAGRQWFWVGLRNDTARQRVICVLEMSYEWTRRSGVTEVQGAIGSPISGMSMDYCADPARRHLVLPGEALLSAVGVDRDVVVSAAKLAFIVSACESSALNQPCSREVVVVRSEPVPLSRTPKRSVQ